MTHMQTYHIIQLQFWYRRFITYERYSTYINMIHFSWFFKCTICMYHISTYIQIYMAHISVHTPMISYDTYIFHALNGLFFRGFSSGALSDDHRAGSRPSHRQSPGRAHGAQFWRIGSSAWTLRWWAGDGDGWVVFPVRFRWFSGLPSGHSWHSWHSDIENGWTAGPSLICLVNMVIFHNFVKLPEGIVAYGEKKPIRNWDSPRAWSEHVMILRDFQRENADPTFLAWW